MSRRSINVNRQLLVSSIAEAEKNGPLINRITLSNKVAEIYNSKTDSEMITHSVVTLRIKEWSLTVKTPVGKRGRAAGIALTDEQKAAMKNGRKGGRAAKFAKNEDIQKSFDLMYQRFDSTYKGLVDRAKAGSLKAAVKLHCLDCSNFQPNEVKNCVCNYCPLYPFRPYQTSNVSTTTEELEVEKIELEKVETEEIIQIKEVA
jgi:hypothetical protein